MSLQFVFLVYTNARGRKSVSRGAALPPASTHIRQALLIEREREQIVDRHLTGLIGLAEEGL
jgi:hypothetical protein